MTLGCKGNQAAYSSVLISGRATKEEEDRALRSGAVAFAQASREGRAAARNSYGSRNGKVKFHQRL
jgi:hypothetical protein